MGKFATFSTPILFRSKLLLFSLLYLLFSLFLAFHFTLSTTKCTFRSSPFDPLQGPLFYYPPSYGQHKHAIPTTRSFCTSPVYFADYLTVVEEIGKLFRRTTTPELYLKYMQRNAKSFGGNLSFEDRSYYFNQSDDGTEIPCGFFKQFPIRSSDWSLMEKCKGLVVVSAIFNDHDKIRQPRGLGSKTLDNVCFFMFVDDATLKRLHIDKLITLPSKNLKIGVWRLVRVQHELLYENPAMNGVIPKYLVHRLFPNSKYSIWLDAKLQMVVDPLLLIHSLVVKEGADMALSRHPFFVHTMEEAMATARWKKWWDVDGVKVQMDTYCENGLQPWSSNKNYPSDVPDSAMILRKHNAPTNLFSCLLFNELEGFNPRDQLPFAFVRDSMSPSLKLNMFEVQVFEQIVIEYRHNLKHSGGGGGGGGSKVGPRAMTATSDLFANRTYGKCEGYLRSMWGEWESHD